MFLFDFSEEVSSEKIPYDPQQISITRKVISLDQIIRRIQTNTINLSPSFQRKEVWDKSKKSLLIESLLLNIPIPLFYVSADRDGNWEVVDGVQRLSTIRDFIISRSLKLNKLEFLTDLQGYTFDDLSPIYYNRIFETEFSFIVIEPDTPDIVKYNIFKRINTGGKPLSSQEIRHAIYNGEGNKVLERLVSSEILKKACGGSVSDERMSMQETILRCLIFMILGTKGYKSNDNMESFLNRGMNLLNNLEKIKTNSLLNFQNYKDLENKFLLSMERNAVLFEKEAFRISLHNEKRTQINKALFDVWGTLLSEISEQDFNLLLKKRGKLFMMYDKLKQNPSFYDAVSRTAWQKNNVELRYQNILKLMKDVIS